MGVRLSNVNTTVFAQIITCLYYGHNVCLIHEGLQAYTPTLINSYSFYI